MIIPLETPFKVLKYLNKLFLEKQIQDIHINEKIIIYLKDRAYLTLNDGKLYSSKKFEDLYLNKIQPVHLKLQTFIDQYSLQYLESHYVIGEFEILLRIENDKARIISSEFSHQQILSYYFNSSKYTHLYSNLSKAIKAVLCLNAFPEEGKDFQFVSILYPKKATTSIILCENLNRLKMPRHENIEFWYAGGRNTTQLAYSPKPTVPIYYLFDWDHDGIGIYLNIKEKHFSDLKAFIPIDYSSLMVDPSQVKRHASKWTNESKKMLAKLHGKEGEIAANLIEQNKIIEEQKIQVSSDNLSYKVAASVHWEKKESNT